MKVNKRTQQFVYLIECILLEKHYKKKGVYTGRKRGLVFFHYESLGSVGLINCIFILKLSMNISKRFSLSITCLFPPSSFFVMKKGDGGLNQFLPILHKD